MNRDNQAGKADAGWLAGFFDGEGYIGLWKGRNKKYVTYGPRIKIFNIHRATMEHFASQMKLLGLPFFMWARKPQKATQQLGWYIEIQGHKRVKKFIEVLLPHVVLKKEQMELMLEYINYRLSVLPNFRDDRRYGSYDEEVFQKMKELKRISESSEAIRPTVHKTEDMVPSAQRCAARQLMLGMIS